jgi:hypothetical protein
MTFQVAYIPTISEVGSVKELIGRKTLTAKDEFTGEILEIKSKGDTTRMTGEKDYNFDIGVVRQ